MPQRTARRASRFFWLRLFFTSDSESSLISLSLRSDVDGALDNLVPRGRRRAFRREEVEVAKEKQWEGVLVDTVSIREQQWFCCCCNGGHCLRDRINRAMLL